MAYVNIVTYVDNSTWKHEGIWSYGNKPLLWMYRLFPYLKVSCKSKLSVPARDTSIDKVLIQVYWKLLLAGFISRASFVLFAKWCILSRFFSYFRFLRLQWPVNRPVWRRFLTNKHPPVEDMSPKHMKSKKSCENGSYKRSHHSHCLQRPNILANSVSP